MDLAEASNSKEEDVSIVGIRGGDRRADGYDQQDDFFDATSEEEERRDSNSTASLRPPPPAVSGADDPASDEVDERGGGGEDGRHHRRYASFAPEILRLGDYRDGGEEVFREMDDRTAKFDRSRTVADATQLLQYHRRQNNSAEDGDRTTTSMSIRVSPIENQDGVRREQVAEVREEDEAVPMSPLARRILQLRHLLLCCDLGFRFGKRRRSGDTTGSGDDDSACCRSEEDDEKDEFGKEKHPDDEKKKSKRRKKKKQYRITSKQTTVSRSTNSHYGRCILTALGLAYDPESDILVNGPILAYVSWSFRASFLATFCSMLVVFMTWVVFFAAWLALAGYLRPECVYVSGEEYYDSDKVGSFADLFQLSWTTFSTVGYGSVFPSTSVQTQSQLHCSFVQFLCTVEAFVGVLYAGFCGAILFGKVSRVQSNARVMFSDPLCVRYGHDGVGCLTDERDEDEDEDGEDGDMDDHDNERDCRSGDDDLETGGVQKSEKKNRRDDQTSSNIPCPLLEFRVINERSNFFGGAIMDASLSCVASMITALNNRGELLVSTSSCSGDDCSGSLYADQRYSIRSRGSGRNNSTGSTAKGGGNRGSAARKMFKPVELEASNHPFFQRVWNARHVLDADSPLLRDRVRRMIRENGGYWPPELNSAKGVRGSLRFSQIIVSFSGVSQISAQSVYAQKIYDFVDINVGYRFAPVLYQNKDSNKLSVDMTMINDVEEQNGGGGEPLCCGDEDDSQV